MKVWETLKKLYVSCSHSISLSPNFHSCFHNSMETWYMFSISTMVYIYLINQARGPYWENIGPRSWQYGPSAARYVQKRLRADILPLRSRASLVNKRFITRLKKAKTAKTRVPDHSGQCPVRYLENIGLAIEHFDWLILVKLALWLPELCNKII